MVDGLVAVKTALISASDKTGLVDFAKKLEQFRIEMLATGGTFTSLKAAGVKVRSLQEDMRLPEAISGRVKTLHSPLFAAILAKNNPQHFEELRSMGVSPVDLVVCNFYPFERVLGEEGVEEERLVENIDIGGPSMVRAASKNFDRVTVVPSPKFYPLVIDELAANHGCTSMALRRTLALEAFGITAAYDSAIYNGLWARRGEAPLPTRFLLASTKFQDARYGENPDQRATIYSIDGAVSMTGWTQLAGEALSFNNYLDIGSAYDILEGFEDTPAAATVKHGNISGLAYAPTIEQAYRLAHACDPEADFGGTVILNRDVGPDVAGLIGKNEGADDESVYTEILIAPGFDLEALQILKAKQKKKMRLIRTTHRPDYRYDLKSLEGAVLVQEAVDYRKKLDASKSTVPTKAKPDEATFQKLLSAWEVVRRVQSNGIVIADGTPGSGRLSQFWTLGVASFRKRNGAVKIALENAGERAEHAVCASDGFFPFRDNVDLLGRAGVTAVIQPGGSVSDREIVAAADEQGMSMVFTHVRAFKH